MFGRCQSPGSGCRMAGAEAALLPYPVLLCALLAVGLQTPVAGRTLRFVNLIYRHGDRSPAQAYPSDPYTEKDWPQGFAQLTQVGMRQHYALGQYLRRRYNGFLNSSYDRHEIYVRSTDIDRTLMSAEVNLAGLYPPQGRQIFHPGLSWQPIPVHTVPVEQDKLLKFPLQKCPRYEKLLEETFNSRAVEEKTQKNKDFLNMISDETKMKVTIQNEWKVYDTLFCEKTHNFSLPSWATHEVITRLSELNDFGMEMLFRLHKTQEKSRLQGGFLLKQILQNINQAINESTPTPRLKLIMYSAHDVTLIALQMALNVYDAIIPPYASCFMFELYEEDDRSFTLDMYFRNQSDSEPHRLTLPSCTEHCPLQDFIQITKHLIADNWEEECKVSSDSTQTGTVLAVALSVCFALLSVLGIVLCWRWKRKTRRLRVPTSSDELA
ncbi:lysosomal acid phosphatase-like isoform X3 [Pristis pectinata]|uniref:lysosomal acid phosphatase-like isoform X3 n=1 Tax=Pristis pectinata TaxID=685728 RepID=UPI00223E5DC3|nr:lysosomal acid phosphatase-like isoform X3 [Pristis pectinata]